MEAQPTKTYKNSEARRQQWRDYRKNNRDKIRLIKQAIIVCECGIQHKYDSKSNHIKTKRHKRLMALKIPASPTE